MAKTHPFYSIHTHGFVRVAAATPAVRPADPAFNARAAVELAQKAHEQGCGLVVYPELNLSAYAIDDLLHQQAVLDACETAIAAVAKASEKLSPVLVMGAPIRRADRLYNCAVVVHRGRVLGVVPKTFLPNYREYYEKRWFASGAGLKGLEVTVAGQTAPFGVDLLFEASDQPGFVVGVEICEDYWAPLPPSTLAALAGARILCNLSASNVLIGKADERSVLCRSQSMRASCAYVFAASGYGESTTDLSWDGQSSIHELGALLAEGERFSMEPHLAVADVDVQKIGLGRLRDGTFADTATQAGEPSSRFRLIQFEARPSFEDIGLRRPLDRFPFVPDDPARLDQDCYEAFNIQVQGLMRRMQATNGKRIVLGVSGGLDSTHALLVACRAFDRLEIPRSGILGFTLPGLATGEKTKANAWALMKALGITGAEIDIAPAARQMLADIGHPSASGEAVYDTTFENVQAGLRTDYLFRLAGQHKAFVLGTGDLSELALGWATYGVGDHMSHYNVNPGVPKTLIQHLVRWVMDRGLVGQEAVEVLRGILSTPISPELVPPGPDGHIQDTQSTVGPYPLQDFALFHITRYGFPPSKVAFMLWRAWKDMDDGLWPPAFPVAERVAYDLPTVKAWLEVFLTRFFALSQYKRSAMPNGPKVVSGGSLSPRGDWRAPSDGNADAWLAELRANVPRPE
ncbi:MAG TPA: NAD(+) synthase [Caulobacteraceae bacterium]